MKKAFLGLDTSNYTTSLAIIGVDGELVVNLKRPLKVKPGERGLRQSDALFSHTVNLPELMQEAKPYFDEYEPIAVGVSIRPRNVEGSYMPCFLAGTASAESISTAMRIPLYRFSHQCGHIMAALYSSGREDLLGTDFAAFHISGGTTELVRVHPEDCSFRTELLGGTADLNAGQVIDRVGVYMGLDFPAGHALEELALKNTAPIPKKKISVNGMTANLSGLENMATSLYRETASRELVAAFVFDYIGRAIDAMSSAYEEKFGMTEFVYAGGVMCNSIIKNMLMRKHRASFARPEMSADNAVGIAALTRRAYDTGRS